MSTGQPFASLDVAERPGHCPSCNHAAGQTARREPSKLREAFGLRPRAARCGVQDPDDSGWGVEACGCKNGFHGS